MKKSGQQKRSEYVRLLKTVEKLKSLSEDKLMRISDCLEETTFTKGDYIIRQGEAGDTFYILQNGKVKVTQSNVSQLLVYFLTSLRITCNLLVGKRSLALPQLQIAIICFFIRQRLTNCCERFCCKISTKKKKK